jgi:serine/threonine protein kinase
VAIKVLSANLSHSVGAERFQREVALMAKLVHPGIMALFDSGEVDGRLYYVMPFVAGENLRARLARERRMTVEDATGFGADVAEALAYAHGAGIVHRDVKPENIFTVGGWAVFADFGIAHIAGEIADSDASLTAEPYLTRIPADQIVIGYAALGEWHKAMNWVERAYDRRPVRLRRMLTEPPFDRRGLAVDRRYARLLRMAVMEELMQEEA